VSECIFIFDFPSIESAISKKKEKFLRKFIVSHALNSVICIFIASAKTELVRSGRVLRRLISTNSFPCWCNVYTYLTSFEFVNLP